MTVESFLTRELDIRFIDARSITNEAKVNLNIRGYPNKYQEHRIKQEALRIFSKRSEVSKETMRRLSETLEAVKFPDGGSSMEFSDTESCDSMSLNEDSLSFSLRKSILRLSRR